MCQEDCSGGSWPQSLVRIFAVDTGEGWAEEIKDSPATEGGRGINGWEAGSGGV